MSTTTENYDLITVEGGDRVNPLTQVNPNFETIDAQMKANANAGVGIATEIKTGNVHALTRTTNNGDCATFRFVATSVFNSGDTFTVDGVSVTAVLPSGEALGDNAFVIGSNVLCVLTSTELTVYTIGGTAIDSKALNGQPAQYYLNAANENFSPTGTTLVSTNTEDAIKEGFNKNKLTRVVGAIHAPVSIPPNTTTYYGILDPSGSTSWTGYDMSKLISIVPIQTSTDYNVIITGSWVTNNSPLVTIQNRTSTAREIEFRGILTFMS